ncbi:MAG: hypothetical protein Q7S86_04780 [bacterium]|nr:hypothetical protein [bacterium]
MARIAPSKKISLLAITSLIFLGGLVYFLFYMGGTETYVAPTVSTSSTNKLLAKDTDGDGLKDWEEQLWKSDLLKPDSDNDGTPDGLEIKNGRNPIIAGPNDKLDLDTVTNKINTETEADLSETDKFSRDLFLKIIAAKKADAPPSEEDLENFLNASIEQEMKIQSVKAYEEGDFQVDSAETPEKIKAYGEKIAEIMNTKPSQPLENELIIFERAENNNDPNELKKLDPLIAQYRWIEDSLLKTVVPGSALSHHIAFANSIKGMIYSITGLKYVLTDPIKALPGVDVYDRNLSNFINSLLQFRGYFETVGVTFVAGDRGYNYFDKLEIPE